MEYYFYFFIFILGTVIGSFLNVLIDRIPRGESIIKSRSYCEHCSRKLTWNDLIPVISYVMLRGRCRYCHTNLGFYYPLVEFLTGIVYVLLVYSIFQFNLGYLTDIRYLLATGYLLYVISSLIVLFFTDLKYGIIPFTIVFFAILLTFLWLFLLPTFHFTQNEMVLLSLKNNYLLNFLLAGLGVFSFFLLLFFITKGKGLGFGDVIYVFLMGLVLGFPKIILGLYIAFLSGAIISVLLVVFGRKKFKGGAIPFGPFLVLGTICSLLWGNSIIAKVMAYLFIS